MIGRVQEAAGLGQAVCVDDLRQVHRFDPAHRLRGAAVALTGTVAEVMSVGQIGDCGFEVGALTLDVASSYEKPVRA